MPHNRPPAPPKITNVDEWNAAWRQVMEPWLKASNDSLSRRSATGPPNRKERRLKERIEAWSAECERDAAEHNSRPLTERVPEIKFSDIVQRKADADRLGVSVVDLLWQSHEVERDPR